jgi:hypothetical protein
VLFERLLVDEERIADAEVAEPFAPPADPELPDRLEVRPSPESGASFWRRVKSGAAHRGARI